jgi:small-conductance mechanosensitive channel
MLYLAQIQKKGYLGKAGLRLLASQKSEHVWTLEPEQDIILSTDAAAYSEDLLVLVEFSSSHQVASIREATDWVLELVQKYLSYGITPAFLQQETERAEQWRQSLTLQSQELERRTLELEARREQIQDLEEDLKRQKKELELLTDQAKLQSQELDQRMQDSEGRPI